MRRVPLYRSLWKPIMYMGCERVPFMVVLFSSALLVMQGGLWVKVGGVVYFFIMVGIMAIVNSRDPFSFKILWRYKSYQDFYPSNALYPGKKDRPINF